MSVKAILDVRLDPAALEAAYAAVHSTLVDTRAFAGCVEVEVLVDDTDPAHLMFIETWASPEHDAAYRAWRAGAGASKELGAVLTAAPVLTKGVVAARI